MKKLLLAAFALAVFTASAYANCTVNGTKIYCQWSANECWPLSDTGQDESGKPVASTCEQQAGYCPGLYQGTKEGKQSCSSLGNSSFTCNGCTYTTGAVVYCWYGPRDEANDTGGCWSKPASDGCGEGGWESQSSTCADAPTTKYCDYGPPSEYGDGGCYAVMGEANMAKCREDSGEVVDVCPTSYPSSTSTGGGNSSPSTQSSPSGQDCSGERYYTVPGCGGYSPIITLQTPFAGNALIAMQNAVNLQVKGTATLRIYDMKGKALSSQMIEQGNHVVSLQLPRGLYIIKATSGSWKQTVKVTVK